MPGRHLRARVGKGKMMAHVLRAALLSLLAATASAQPAAGRQLVVPFESASRLPHYHWLSEGSAVILTDILIALGAPTITHEDRRRAFEHLRVPANTTLSHATVIRLGELVAATEVIIGSFDVRPAPGGGDREDVILRVRSIRLSTGRLGREIVESGPLPTLLDVFARAARRLRPGSPVSSVRIEQEQPPIAAIEQYVKGLLAQAPATRVAFLRQALKIHPALHRARLELWRVHTDEEEHEAALAAVRGVAPDHRLARQSRFLAAVSLISLRRYDEARMAIEELSRAKPDPALLNNIGIIQLRRGAAAGDVRASQYFRDAARLDDADPDLFFNAGYAFWLEKDMPNAITWLREAVRRNPADDAAHYVLGVALEATGAATEGAREKELARRLSSEYAEWEAKQPGVNAPPGGLERMKTDIDVPASLRVETTIVAAAQRDQRELAAFHLQAGQRAYEAERDADAIAELRRSIFLSPYQHDAHLLLARAYLRSGRPDEAIDAVRVALWINDTIPGHLVLTEAYLLARDTAAARDEIAWILKADPQNTAARELLERAQP